MLSDIGEDGGGEDGEADDDSGHSESSGQVISRIERIPGRLTWASVGRFETLPSIRRLTPGPLGAHHLS